MANEKEVVTTNEIMESIKNLTENVNDLTVKTNGLADNLNNLTVKTNGLTDNVNNLTDNLNELTSFLQEHMVTRTEMKQELNKTKLDILDGVDDKLADLRGDLVILLRKEDKKVDHLIKLLQDKSVITTQDASTLLEIRPFPQSVA